MIFRQCDRIEDYLVPLERRTKYPTDNHRVPLQEVKAWMKQRRWLVLGFGISVIVISMIPILNFFTIPAAKSSAHSEIQIESNQ